MCCPVAKHHDGERLLACLEEEAVVCVQLEDGQLFWFVPELRATCSSSSNAMAAAPPEKQVGDVAFLDFGLRGVLWTTHMNTMPLSWFRSLLRLHHR